nr:MAG: RNA-dependent RNA polymerase [Wufeng shrew rotavirus 1]WPV63701.1 MAG: RNA-dependent RNA polymerase [Wufeng shrew rotavirus 1]
MDVHEYLDWISKSIIRDLTYVSLVYTNPKVGIVTLNKINNNQYDSFEEKVSTPDDMVKHLTHKLQENINDNLKLKYFLSIRYFTIYVDDKSDKRDIVLVILNSLLSKLETDNISISNELLKLTESIKQESLQWRTKNSYSFKNYHYDQEIKHFFSLNPHEFKETDDPFKWKSDTLEGMIPHYNHRTHTLISSIVFSINVRYKKYSNIQKETLLYLLRKIKDKYISGYIEIQTNKKWSIPFDELQNCRHMLYSQKIIHACCAMISILHAEVIDNYFLCQIIESYSIIPAHAAKQLSSPMTLYIGICQLDSNIVVSTDRVAECVSTSIPNVSRLDDRQLKEWNDEYDNYPFKSSILINLMNKNIYNVSIDIFKLIFNCFSATFHVGHRIDNPQDAIRDQVSVSYSSDINREMYDQYYYQLKRMFKKEILHYIDSTYHKYGNDVTAESLSALANSSNGFPVEVEFIDRTILTTKKILHLDNALLKQQNLNDYLQVMENGIPMGTRNVPARQTRGIFILPWQVSAIQHTIAESMYKRAKAGAYSASFAEAYTAKTAILTYGILAQATSKADQLILYTDVSQWDASQHNTEPYRSAWINGIQEARIDSKISHSDEPHVLGLNILDHMIYIQQKLLNSKLLLSSKGSNRQDEILTYHGVASGEKTTKIGNSYANIALITTVLRNCEIEIPNLRVTHVRVDGDDNVVVAYCDTNIAEVQNIIKDKYSKMNVRVKALASYTGLEMAKRFIICGKIFERGAISIFTAERPYGSDVSIQTSTGSLLYSAAVNAFRGFGDSYLSFMQDVLIPPSASTRVTGRLRLLLTPVSLFSTGSLSFEVTPYGLGGRMRLYTDDEELMSLFKTITNSISISVTPKDIKNYSKTKQFNIRVDQMIKSLQTNMKSQALIITKILKDKEEQKTLGIPHVNTQKNRMQIEKSRKSLSLISTKLEIVKDYYPDELFSLVVSKSRVDLPTLFDPHNVYMFENNNLSLLQLQIGVRVSERKIFTKPQNTLMNLINKHSPIHISPSDIFRHSKNYKLSTIEGKKQFLSDVGLTGSELRFYLNSKLLFHDLLVMKYDKLYDAPGFGSVQLNSVPLDLSSAEIIFKIQINMPTVYYEIMMLLLLYEYVNYVMFTGKLYTFHLRLDNQTEISKFTSQIMTMIDNIKLDNVMFSDNPF